MVCVCDQQRRNNSIPLHGRCTGTQSRGPPREEASRPAVVAHRQTRVSPNKKNVTLPGNGDKPTVGGNPVEDGVLLPYLAVSPRVGLLGSAALL